MTKNNKITITVKLFAFFQKYGPKKSKVSLPQNSKVKDLLEIIGIPYKERDLLILINGKPHQTEESSINEEDLVAIFPPLGGG